VDRYAKDLYKRLDGFSNGNGNRNVSGLAKDYDDDDDDYCIAIGSEPLRFASYRRARAKKKIGDCLTFEDVYDSITQDELDYYLKAKLRVSPEERYQHRKENWFFHESSCCSRGLEANDGKGCNGFTGCVPECRYYAETGTIEDEEVIEEHNKLVESLRQENAIADPPSESELLVLAKIYHFS
jgi:hypothetical protein